jgi:hypothetical protein
MQKVGLRPPQFVAHFAQPLHSQENLSWTLAGRPAEPSQEGARSVFISVKETFVLGTWFLVYSQLCELANGGTKLGGIKLIGSRN